MIARREIGPWAWMIGRKSQTAVGELRCWISAFLTDKEGVGGETGPSHEISDFCLLEITGWNSVRFSFFLSPEKLFLTCN